MTASPLPSVIFNQISKLLKPKESQFFVAQDSASLNNATFSGIKRKIYMLHYLSKFCSCFERFTSLTMDGDLDSLNRPWV